MKRGIVLAAILALGAGLPAAGGEKWYDSKAYDRWSEKEVEKILEKSPWSQTHTYRGASSGGAITRAAQQSGGIAGDAGRDIGVEFRNYLRFQWFSSRPIRMALARLALANNPGLDRAQLDGFATSPMPDAVLMLMLDSSPPGSPTLQAIRAGLGRLTLEDLAEETRLETSDGEEVRLTGYRPPEGDGTGAKFIFPRTRADGKPLLRPSDKEVRFFTKLPIPGRGGSEEVHIRLKYKIKDMVFQGALDY